MAGCGALKNLQTKGWHDEVHCKGMCVAMILSVAVPYIFPSKPLLYLLKDYDYLCEFTPLPLWCNVSGALFIGSYTNVIDHSCIRQITGVLLEI